jgi:hypothetical protein
MNPSRARPYRSQPHAKCGIPMQYEPPRMDIPCLPKAASPTWTSHIVNRNVLMLALTAAFSLATAVTPAQATATLDPQSTRDSMQSDPVRSDSDAAHANSPSY